MNFATKEIKAEDFFDDVEDEAGPPHLSRETFDKNEEEDNFVEMEDDDDEVECPIPVCKPGTAIARRAKNFQEEDQNIDLDEAYPISGAKNRRLKFDYDQSKYSVQYRDSQFKSNAKNSHKVAIVIKHDENICHEFSYNRTAAGDGSKYYTCLGCRKAKIETYKDVIRTIRIDDTYGQILSKGDPFGGHHYQCQPLAWTPDARSYGHVHPQPMHMDLGEYAPSEYVYLDGDAASNSLLNIASIPFYGEQGPPQISSIKKEVVETIKKPSRVQERPAQFLSFYQRQMRKKRLSQSHKPRCHICTRTLPSTESLIIHLQRHLDRAESSVKTRSFI